jgi:hypothetical protein
MCVICREVQGKRALIRIVRTPVDGVMIDDTGKRAGRGAYLCQRRSCWQRALTSNALNRALRTTLTETELAALAVYATTLPADDEADL